MIISLHIFWIQNKPLYWKWVCLNTEAKWKEAHYSRRVWGTKSRQLIVVSGESERVPSFNFGFSHNEIKANMAACKWVKHNIHYESNYGNANQSAASHRWGCFDESEVYHALCIRGGAHFPNAYYEEEEMCFITCFCCSPSLTWKTDPLLLLRGFGFTHL